MDTVPLPLKLKINILLRAKQNSQARDLTRSKQAFDEIKEDGMELITQICDHGLNETDDSTELVILGDMLLYIAKHFNPKLALISFLEQAEAFNFSSKFSTFVQPLKAVVSRMENKKPSNIGWICRTLNSHLKTFESIPQIVKKYKNQNGWLALQNDPDVQQMLHFYNELCTFYEDLARDLRDLGASCSSTALPTTEQTNALKCLLRDNLVELLGPPLVHMSLSWNAKAAEDSRSALRRNETESHPGPKSDARIIAEKILHILTELNCDPNYFISWVELNQASEGIRAEDNDDNVDKNDDRVQLPLLSVCCFMYLIYGEKLSPTLLPASTYSPSYIFCNSLYLVQEFLSAPLANEDFQLKGLALARGIIELINSASLFTSETFDLPRQSTFLKQLGTLMVFCDSRSVRVAAVDVFTKYLWAYDAKGKRRVLTHLFNTVSDPGLHGHCITQLKEFIVIALNEKEKDLDGENTMAECFLQSSLVNILHPLCTLDNGVQTNLVHSCNKIIPLLNLLRYLFIRDGTKNLSGIKRIMSHLESNFMKPMRTALDLSKHHFQGRLTELEDSEGPVHSVCPAMTADVDVSISVVGADGEEELPMEGTKENQIQYVKAVLGTLDLLESLWVRVNETSMTP